MAQASSEMMGNWTVMDGSSFKKDWKAIGGGGGGQVFKARHLKWGKDMAIKIIGRDDGCGKEKLVAEAELMLRAESPYTLKVWGVFIGCTPHCPEFISVGVVMDLMERGCLYSLQEKREHQPLPWPLVFRLVHQVALGMKYLHSLKPDALVHKDLKPHNILLDPELNVKITDFGLAKFANTVTVNPLKGMKTVFFAPPEAFLKPEEAPPGGATCAYDVYSYAVLAWTLLNPAYNDTYAFDVSHGVTSLEEVKRMEVPGLDKLVELMERCWNKDPGQRPTFAECTAVTEDLYEKNKLLIKDSVGQVKEDLDGAVIRKYPNRDFQQLTLDTNTAYDLPLSDNNGKLTLDGQRHSYPDHPDRLAGVRGQLSKFNIAFRPMPRIEGARTQYMIEPEKKYLDGEKAEDSKLRKFTIGKKDPQQPNKTVILVGETGAGKSTLIDAILNHLMGTAHDSNEWCKIIDEGDEQQTSSQTEKITVYEICAFHNDEFPYSLTIIDTPGFGDTRGVDRDLQLPRVLEMLFRDEVTEVGAVALVLKESTNRLDDRQRYIFNSVLSLFGKDMENNIVALITHSAGVENDTPLKALAKAGIKIARNEEDDPICFAFQNNQTSKGKGQKYKKAKKFAWSTTNDGMTEFFDFLKKVESQNLQQTSAVLNKRIQLEARADSFSERIQMIEAKKRAIDQTKEALKQLESGKAVAIEIDEPYKELQKSKGFWHNKTKRCTICLENCHRKCNCWFCCAAMKDGKCTSCKGKCESKGNHVRDEYKYVTKTKKVTVVDTGKELKRELEKKEEELARTKEEEIDQIYLCIVELDAIALKGNSIYTYKHLAFLIEKLKELGVERNIEKIKKLTEVKTRIEKNEGEGIRYMLASLGNQGLGLISEMGRQVRESFNPFSTGHECGIEFGTGVRGQLSKFNIAFHPMPRIEGARTQYMIEPEKKYLDGEKAEDSKLRKFTIGKKDPQQPNKTVILVGETGAGKSTLIDAILNHLMGTAHDSNEWCKIIDEGDKQQTTSSQTEKITVYEICAFHNDEFPYSLTIIDTPGFGDTRGVDRDLQLPRVLEMLFRDEVTEVGAVALVLKESTNRLDGRQRYIFNSVVSLFGKDMENNIVALITHSAGVEIDTPLKALAKAGIKIARNEEDDPICFAFQNNQTSKGKGKGQKYKKAMKFAWSTTNDGMTEFFDFLKKVESQNLQQTSAVLNKRIQLEARADSFSERIQMIEAKKRAIDQTKEALKQLESGKAVAIEIDEPYKELQKSKGFWHNKTKRCTICLENCHRKCNCWFCCAAMKDGKCTSCKGKCESKGNHVRDEYKYVTKTKKVTVVDTGKELKRELEKKEEELARTKEEEIDQIYLCIVELDAIALKGNSIYTYKHLAFLIEKLKELGVERNIEKIKKLTEVKTRIEKNEGEGIRYMLASLGNQGLGLISEMGRHVRESFNPSSTGLECGLECGTECI